MKRAITTLFLFFLLTGCASYNTSSNDAAYTADITSQEQIWREVTLPVLLGERVPSRIWHTPPHVRVPSWKIQMTIEDGKRVLALYLDRCSVNERLQTYLKVERVSLQLEDFEILRRLHAWLLAQPGCLEDVHQSARLTP